MSDEVVLVLTKTMFGLLNVGTRFKLQVRHQNESMKKIFLRSLPRSKFLAKALSVKIKIATKSFSKNLFFGVDFKL